MFCCLCSSYIQSVLSTGPFSSSSEHSAPDKQETFIMDIGHSLQHWYCLHDASCLNHFLIFPEFSAPTSLYSNGNSNNFFCFCQSSQGILKIRKYTFWNGSLIEQSHSEKDFTSFKSCETRGTCTTAIYITGFQFWAMASWIQKDFHCLSLLRLGAGGG